MKGRPEDRPMLCIFQLVNGGDIACNSLSDPTCVSIGYAVCTEIPRSLKALAYTTDRDLGSIRIARELARWRRSESHLQFKLQDR